MLIMLMVSCFTVVYILANVCSIISTGHKVQLGLSLVLQVFEHLDLMMVVDNLRRDHQSIYIS